MINKSSNSRVSGIDKSDDVTDLLKKVEGFFNYYHSENEGKIYMEVRQLDEPFLYVNALVAGVGSNDIGLDRGQLGDERVVKFNKYGNKLLLIQPNLAYRAISQNKDEIRSVKESFAISVLASFNIISQKGRIYVIDVTDFLIRDSHQITRRLSQTKQGSYQLDKSRSAIYSEGVFNFPKNTEFEAILTYSGVPKGRWIRSVTPTAAAVTVRTHHSFIELPDADYSPRIFDPRCGFFYMSYNDYATPIEQPLKKRLIVRHRLKKKFSDSVVSEPIEPIVYYVDRGAPPSIREALIEGASWWNQAFEAAGFKNAFQVKLLPEDVHPMDVRYNIIQWVHRSTRGWSYGSGITDPRTGEMIKGHVSLGTLRVRQDFLLATGLLQPYQTGIEIPTEMTKMALARIRQLAAHEVGHTLGLAHNFAASTNNRASVMDYPFPFIEMDNQGNINLSNAYDDKIGKWDQTSITYGYGEFPSETEQYHLDSILNRAFNAGLRYITDQDARPINGLHPQAHLWDNGKDAVTELDKLMKIRSTILQRFSEKAIPYGTPMSSLEEVLVPMYLLHRYQVEAVSKIIGGLTYEYNLRGKSQGSPNPVPADIQMNALNALLRTLHAESLMLPESILKQIPPRAFGYPRNRETFQSKIGPAFDHFAIAETASDIVLRLLFDVGRANRLVAYHSRNSSQPHLKTMIDLIFSSIWKNPSTHLAIRAVQKVTESQMLKHLMALAKNPNAYSHVQAVCYYQLENIKHYANAQKESKTTQDQLYYQYIVREIDRFMKEPEKFVIPTYTKAPDGSPIGSCDFDKRLIR